MTSATRRASRSLDVSNENTRIAVRFHNFKNERVKHLEKYYKDINGMMYLTNANSLSEQYYFFLLLVGWD
jgi:CMP-N-acetylneuraminic acid synthetase